MKKCNFLIFLILERQKRMAPRCEGESDRKDEEDWQLKDVVFVEDVKTVPIGMMTIISILLYLNKIFFDSKMRRKELNVVQYLHSVIFY